MPEAQINGVDQANLTLDAPREVEVTLQSETSRSVDSLLVYDIGDDGAMTNVRTVFAGMNTPDQVHFGPGQTTPGTTASLGVVGAGTQLGFVLVNDGERDYGDLFGAGRFELRSGEGPGVARNTDEAPPRLVHVAPDGTETVLDERLYFTADDSQDTDNNNALHLDGLGHLVSGIEGSSLVIGFEDGEGPANRLGTGYDRDFNDAVIAVDYGEPEGGGGGDRIVRLDMDLAAQIADPDSTTMTGGVVLLAEGEAGDRLRLPDGVLDGTNITAEPVGAERIAFSGADSIANYEKAMSAVNLVLDPNDPGAGTRTIEANVTDDSGLESNTARTTIAIAPPGDDNSAPPGEDNAPPGDGGPVVAADDFVPLTLNGGGGDPRGAEPRGDDGGDRLALGDVFQGGEIHFEHTAANNNGAANNDGAANDAGPAAKAGGPEIVFADAPNLVSPAALGLEPPQHSDGATS